MMLLCLTMRWLSYYDILEKQLGNGKIPLERRFEHILM
jgi:hypothetical protein